MTKKIFRSIFVVAVTILLSCLILIMGMLYTHFTSVEKSQLKTELSLAADAVETGGIEYLQGLETDGCRLTWVAADGSVLFDSKINAADMENHAQREEIRAAFSNGIGESDRYSSTLMEKTLYCAKLLSDGTVLRISVNHAAIPLLFLGMMQPIIIIFALALILSLVLANRLSKKIVEPLNSLNLDKPRENHVYDELSPLLTHIERQKQQLKQQLRELEKRRNEFYAVTQSMNEGLILLNDRCEILSINTAAANFFSTDTSCVGKYFMSVDRNLKLNKAISNAVADGHSEIQISKNGREYQINASRIEKGKGAVGIALLIFDITDKVFAERNRREFTANISHELKTPLHSIMGSAELLENGMVKAEDIPRFIGHIRSEAARLVTLIEDIIRLSQLDESDDLPLEDVDLYALAKSEVELLMPFAMSKQITLTVEGASTVIKGVQRLVHEITYNLCDNAVKYNTQGGSVTVTVGSDNSSAFLRVSDTGIGIPPEHQPRVFERFYRVDKSHSKETGGTGLGLSIVKHAAQYMGGKIALESDNGKGTVITVYFPHQQK